jgi:predicted transposase YdaD
MLSRYEYQSDFARRFFSAGRQEGRQEGLQEGLHVGQREVIGRLLRRRFGPAASALISRLESLDGGALASLADALMDGADLASLEAGLANLRQS